MHQPHLQPQQALHRSVIVIGVRVVGVLDQRTVVENVAGKQDFRRFLVERDAPGGMAGSVNDLELPIAEVDHVAVLQQARRRRPLHRITLRAIGLGRQGVENVVGNIGVGQRVFACRISEQIRLCRMDRTAFELVVAADVIEMGVACHRDQLTLGDKRDPFTKRDDAHATVNKHVAIAPTHMPDVAAVKFLDMRLADIGHVIVETPDAVPVLRAHALFHHVSPMLRPERRWCQP